MSTLGEELKKIRHEKKLSLEDVYDKIKIDIKFLREIEANNYSFLPKTYVTAFLKEYAEFLKLDVSEINERIKKEIFPEVEKKHEERDKEHIEEKKVKKEEGIKNYIDTDGKIKKGLSKSIIFLIIIIAIIIIFIIKSLLSKNGENFSYMDTLRESETVTSDTLKESRPVESTDFMEDIDSLKIETQKVTIVGIDTTWLLVIPDSQDSMEYVIEPGHRMELSFRDSIVMRIGKSRGVRLVMNNQMYEDFGPENTLVWRLVLTESGIKQKVLRNRSD